MTDIRQHLPLIFSCLRQHLAGQVADTSETIIAYLRTKLPASYGIGVGCLVSAQGERSLPFDVVIYDTTVQPTRAQSDPSLFDRRQVLVVIVLAQQLDVPALRAALRTIASAKSLQPQPDSSYASTRAPTGRKPEPQKRSDLRKLLPLGVIAFQHLLLPETRQTEQLALALDAALKEQAHSVRPDYVLALGDCISYSHPALAGESFRASTINVVREPALSKPHPCYVCKKPFVFAHFFYRHLCASCGDLNYSKRALPADLRGRVALVTGARVKIGYATALRLLRAGARVIVTTRFSHDAARRYSSEPDFADWQDRLQIYGLDFRYLTVLERFIEHLYLICPALDILINNAAQTIRRPADYYAPLRPGEQLPLTSLPPAQQQLVRRSHEVLPLTPFAAAATASQALPEHFSHAPATSRNVGEDFQQAVGPAEKAASLVQAATVDEAALIIDQSGQNSWTLPFNQIDLTEFLEVQTINATAPFLLISHLHPLLCRSQFAQRFIINVSAVEGQFAHAKVGNHVHTNMAKAALNMLTHTTATQLAQDHIYLNSVDPGWISQQSPQVDVQRWERLQQLLPLDLVDAAARVCDPIFLGIMSGEAPSGCFFKDYYPTAW
jgi:NAD(P)-dependent dehydrogenase (short-subunit alcohol dehydrogenase family)